MWQWFWSSVKASKKYLKNTSKPNYLGGFNNYLISSKKYDLKE